MASVLGMQYKSYSCNLKQIFPCAVGHGFSTVSSEAVPCVHVTIDAYLSISIGAGLNLNAANELQLPKVFSVKLPTVLIHQSFYYTICHVLLVLSY